MEVLLILTCVFGTSTVICIFLCGYRISLKRLRLCHEENYPSYTDNTPCFHPSAWPPCVTAKGLENVPRREPWMVQRTLHKDNPLFMSDDNSGRYQPIMDGVQGLNRNVDNRPEVVNKELYVEEERSMKIRVGDKLVVFISRRVDHLGSTLYLDNMAISLFVPPGAVPIGEVRLITLLLNWDLGDNPDMDPKEALVSPVVFVGPHGIKLNRPCVLKYRHCAFDKRHIKVLKCETDLCDRKLWQPMDTKRNMCILTPDECQLEITSFTLYTSIQVPPAGQISKKWLQLAVFCEPLRNAIDHVQVRIYFLNKTNCALQWALQNEEQFGARLICPEKLFLLDGKPNDVITHISYVSRGWTVISDERFEKISFLNIWHGKCPHVSIVFRKENPYIRELNFVSCIMQVTRENECERLIAQTIQENSSHHLASPQVLDLFGLSPPVRSIPQCLRHQLKILLDPQSVLNRNWKCSAEKLGYDGMIPYLESKAESPTEVLLDAAEHKGVSLGTLRVYFEEMQRLDIVSTIQDYLETSRTNDAKVNNNLNMGT